MQPGPQTTWQRSETGGESEPVRVARDQSKSVTGGNNRAPAAVSRRSRASAPDGIDVCGLRGNATGRPTKRPDTKTFLTLEVVPACPTYRR